MRRMTLRAASLTSVASLLRTCFRDHRAFEGSLQRGNEVVPVFGAEIEAVIHLGETFGVQYAVLAGPGIILHAKPDDMHGQLLRGGVQLFAEIARRGTAGLFSIRHHDNYLWPVAIVEHISSI